MKDQTIAVNKIRDSYCEKPVTKLDELKSLDKKVKRPAKIFAYIFGVIGALVLGTGMCLAMKVLGDLMALGIVVGVVGIIMVSINHLIYKQILKKRKSKYCRKILELSEEIAAE
ncbi:MAG: dihydropteridine reductase [Clostridia bacterium]|nr:dihydropteridine reductase [Clostridia bacterium]MDE6211623.1 dihydropteridine reductase [Clostridia bacterium]MDE6604982.1 dihydropteridine reductase [Clostridia bacterium]MDE7208847.1 dihydropteridine reductase [Clostridia bacterium]